MYQHWQDYVKKIGGGDVANAKQKLEAGGIYVVDELRVNPDVFSVMLDWVYEQFHA